MSARSDRRAVFIVCWTLRIGGVERKIADIARCLPKVPEIDKYDVYLILADDTPDIDTRLTFYPEIADTPLKKLHVPKVWLSRYRLTIGLFTLWHAFWLKPVVMLAFMRQLGLICTVVKKLLFWRSIKVYISEDTLGSANLAAETPNQKERDLVRVVVGKLYPRSDLVIAPSDASRDDLISYFGVPPGKIETIKNWIPYDHAQPPDRQPDFDLVYVGRVAPVKDLPFLLSAVCILAGRRPSVRLCLVGDGEDMELVKEIIAEYRLEENISLEGIQMDVCAFLRRGRVFCISSLYEGLPMTVLEAMSQGLPVVARNYPGAEELVRDDHNGYVCATPEAMADALDRLLSDDELRRRLGANGKALVTAEHGLENLQRYVDLLLGRD